MDVLFFYFFLNSGGIEKIFVQMANHWVRHDKTVGFAVMSKTGSLKDVLSSDVPVHDFGLKPHHLLHHLMLIFKLANYIRKNKPKVVITGAPVANITLILAVMLSCRRSKTKIIISEHGPTSEWLRTRNVNILLTLSVKAAIRTAYRFADVIVVVSKGVLRDLRRFVKVPKETFLTLYNPVITDDIRQKINEPNKHPWLKDHSLAVVVSVFRFTVEKNPEMLIDAFARVHKKLPHARLICIGEGPLEEALHTKIEQHGLKEYVDLVGFQENPYAFISKANVFALSSNYEGLPTVVIESLACGCPVVATQCPGGISEILEDGAYGLLVPPGDISKMAEGLVSVLEKKITFKSTDLIARGEFFSFEGRIADYETLVFGTPLK
jgi:glycosyltransferase involved in cell wall biosynthesis